MNTYKVEWSRNGYNITAVVASDTHKNAAKEAGARYHEDDIKVLYIGDSIYSEPELICIEEP